MSGQPTEGCILSGKKVNITAETTPDIPLLMGNLRCDQRDKSSIRLAFFDPTRRNGETYIVPADWAPGLNKGMFMQNARNEQSIEGAPSVKCFLFDYQDVWCWFQGQPAECNNLAFFIIFDG